jgi:sorbitol-specific phosphotransferase system component IIBC
MTLRLTSLSLAVLLVVACGSGKAPATGATPDSAVATLRVDNQRFTDMTLYVIEAGVRQRLGIAPGNTVSSFTIPRRVASGPILVRFIADPIGGKALPVTEDITVEAGDEVTMRIMP